MKKKPLFFILFYLLLCNLGIAQDYKIEVKELLKQSGNYFLELKNDKSLEFANSALQLSIQNDDAENAAKAYNLIGLNFNEYSDVKKAIEYYKKGVEYAERTSNDTIKAWIYNNLGNAYAYSAVDIVKGIEYYEKGLYHSEKFEDEGEIMYSKLNMIEPYFNTGFYDKGMQYLKEVKDVVENGEYLESKITFSILNALYYEHFKDFKKAESYYLKAVSFCQKNDIDYLLTNVENVYGSVSKFYFERKNYEKAYLFLRRQDSIKDKIYNQERIKAVKLIGNDIEEQESKRKFERIESERLIQDQQIKNNKIVLILLIAMFTILTLFAFTLYKNNLDRRRTNMELVNTNNALVFAKEKAEKALSVKSQFISTISHELRTPLYGVIGTTDIIEEEHAELENSPHLKALKFSANYLLSLVNDILIVYKIEEQKVVLESNLFHLKDKLETIRDSLETICRKNNNKIVIKVAPDVPEYLIGDNIRLSQIIINLLSNSLKFTNNGKVSISVSNISNEGDMHKLKFVVADTGIGIPKNSLDTVFEKFVQLERKEDDYQGTGLGLTIVKKLVDLFGGQILLESEEHVGTTITITLPFQSGDESKDQFLKNIEVDLSLSVPYKILVVEDNKINQAVTKRLLENHNFSCEIVDNGYAAIDLLQKRKFDAILMDINMPLINGFDTSKIIREKGYTLPIIAVTAFDRQEIEEKAKQAQINEIIVKPFDSSKLFEVIRNLLKTH